MYNEGKGTYTDERLAAYWFAKRPNGGVTPALYELGLLIYDNNKAKARQLFQEAAGGFEDAKTALKNLF